MMGNEPTMNHEEAEALFSAYWDEELGPSETGELEEHLRSCIICHKEYQAFERSVGALSGLHRMIAPPEFQEGVRSKIRKRSRGRFFAPKRLAERVPYELFSLLMLGLILAVYLVFSLSHPNQLKLP
jgi:anti-sigma factor RsiW